MAKFVTKFTDKKLHRITLDKDALLKEDIQPGDFIEVAIKKVKLE